MGDILYKNYERIIFYILCLIYRNYFHIKILSYHLSGSLNRQFLDSSLRDPLTGPSMKCVRHKARTLFFPGKSGPGGRWWVKRCNVIENDSRGSPSLQPEGRRPSLKITAVAQFGVVISLNSSWSEF